MSNTKKKPVQVFRLGNISSSIFANTNGESNNSFHSVTLQRSYRDEETTKYDTSFTVRDLPAAMRCLALAQQWVEGRELEG